MALQSKKALLYELNQHANWLVVGRTEDDHKIEQTDLKEDYPDHYLLRKKKAPYQIYVVEKRVDGAMSCLECGTTLLEATVTHPVRNGGCYEEIVPYCPKCEQRPNPIGRSITTNEPSYFELPFRL